MQIQIQALIAGEAMVEAGGATEGVTEGSNIGFNIEMVKSPVFNGEAGKVGGFISAYRLYLRMRMRRAMVEKQIQWVLSYI